MCTKIEIQPNANYFLRLPELVPRVGLKRSSIYRLIQLGQFPKPHQLSYRAVGWYSCDIESWISERLGGSSEPVIKN
jgi:prophage regulatory protein